MSSTTHPPISEHDLAWARACVRQQFGALADQRRAISILRRDGDWMDQQTADRIEAEMPPQTLGEAAVDAWRELGALKVMMAAGAAIFCGVFWIHAIGWVMALMAAAVGGV